MRMHMRMCMCMCMCMFMRRTTLTALAGTTHGVLGLKLRLGLRLGLW